MKSSPSKSLELVRLCCRALAEKKAGDMQVMDVRGISSITDYLVIATATSEPHVRALRIELEKAVDSAKAHIVGFETASESGWAVMDAFDVMVHIFTADRRDHYGLENLWRDGRNLPIDTLLAAPAKPKRKPSVTKKKRVTKKPLRHK